jgi:hypothetical protein
MRSKEDQENEERAMITRTFFIAGLALAGAANAAEIQIFTQPNFAGSGQTFSRDASTLQGSGVFDQSKSVVVRSGRWQVCSQPNFQGDCQVLERGQYASLPQQLNGRIESLREVTQVAEAERYNRWNWEGGGWRERPDWREHRRGGDRDERYGSRGALVLYAEGNSTRYSDDVDNFNRSPYRDGAERMVIREGRWEVCALPDYRGLCRVYDPGNYVNLGRFNNQIGSIRRIG